MMKNLKAKATNYIPKSISFSEGYLYGLIKPDLGYIMMADWDKAKAIIEKLIADGRNIERVEMGLDGDWQENSMTVWEDGKFTAYSCFEGSKWAEPIIIVYYKDAPSEVYSVWRKKRGGINLKIEQMNLMDKIRVLTKEGRLCGNRK